MATFVLTNKKVDRQRDRLLVAAVLLDHFKNNAVMYYNHHRSFNWSDADAKKSHMRAKFAATNTIKMKAFFKSLLGKGFKVTDATGKEAKDLDGKKKTKSAIPVAGDVSLKARNLNPRLEI